MGVQTGNTEGTGGRAPILYTFVCKLPFSAYIVATFCMLEIPHEDVCLPLFESFLRPWYANTSTLLCTSLYHFQAPSSANQRFRDHCPTLCAVRSYLKIACLKKKFVFSFICI